MFVKVFGRQEFLILLLFVNNMLIVGKYCNRIEKLKVELKKFFTMKVMNTKQNIWHADHSNRKRVKL